MVTMLHLAGISLQTIAQTIALPFQNTKFFFESQAPLGTIGEFYALQLLGDERAERNIHFGEWESALFDIFNRMQ
jgi:hypothetical protein